MKRLKKFTSVFGENWLLGRYLLPELRRIGNKQHGILVDLGCGESPFKAWFPRVDSYVRVDNNPVDPGVKEGDMRAIPFPAQSVDIVLLFQSITDVPCPCHVLKEIKRVLRPGGQTLIFESMSYPEHDMPYDFYRLMPEGLKILAEDAGLQMQECIRLGGLFTRFACLWNTFMMGGLKRNSLFRPLGHIGVAAGNLLFYALDHLAHHPRLASDYLAILRPKELNPSVSSRT